MSVTENNELNEKVKSGGKARRDSTTSSNAEDDVRELIPTPPDGGWGWVIVAASLFSNIVVDGIGYSFGIFLPVFVDYFHESRSKVSLVGSLLCGTYLCAGPIVSGLTNKFGCRPVAMAGSLISTVAFILAMFSPNLTVLILTYGVLGGFGFGMIYLPAIVSVGYYFEKKRAFATGIAVCGSGVGTFIFAPLTKFLLDKMDWKNALLILAGLIFNACIFASLMRPLEVKRPKKIPHKEKHALGTINEEAKIMLEVDYKTTDHKTSSISPNFSEKNASPPASPKSAISERPESTAQQGLSTDVNGDRNCEKIVPLHGVDEHEYQSLIKVEHGGKTDRHSSDKSKDMRPGVTASVSGAVGSKSHLWSSTRSISNKDYARPMYRKDIFYSGSVMNITEFRSQPDVSSYIASITSIPGDLGITDKRTDTKLYKICSCLPKPLVDVLSEMLDFSLFSNIGFMCICLGNIFAMIGFYVPYVYIVDRAVLAGIDKTEASLLLSVIGITNTVSRILSGIIADLKFVDSLMLNNVSMLIASITIFVTPFCNSYPLLVAASMVFGLTTAVYISLTSIIICDLLGLEKLTNGFGLLTLARGVSSALGPPVAATFICLTSVVLCDLLGLAQLTNAFGLLGLGRGIAGIIGPPIAGAMFQSTGNYDASFFLGGGLFFLGTLMHFVLYMPCMKSRSKSESVIAVMEMEPKQPKGDPERPILVKL